MGVKGLQYYMENCCPNGCKSVRISDLIRRSYSGDERPVIVIDGSSWIRILYDNLDWVQGGQLKEFGDKVRQYVDSFKRIGVQLVVFFDGPFDPKKRLTWIKRRENDLRSVHQVLDSVANGSWPLGVNDSKYFLIPSCARMIAQIVLKYVCGCEVHQAIKDCDMEIAEYARSHRALAVLAQDSDFIIYDSGAIYLSLKHLNHQTMTTKCYDRNALIHHLRIQATQLPLLATMMGNDIISSDEIKAFHFRIIGAVNSKQFVNVKHLVPKLGQYIHTFPSQQNEFSIPQLKQVSNVMFGNANRFVQISSSLTSYKIVIKKNATTKCDEGTTCWKTSWSELLDFVGKNHEDTEIPSMILTVMSGLPFQCGTIMEDCRKHDLPLYSQVTLSIRRCLYGILFQEKTMPVTKVEELCMAGSGSLDKSYFVTPQFPSRPHPGLQALWGGNQRYSNSRWELFVHSVSPRLDVAQLQSIPRTLVFPTLILSLIFRYLEPWEVDAVLATAVTIKLYKPKQLANLHPVPLHSRGIRICHLIMQTTYIMFILLAACGYPVTAIEAAPWNFIDGKLFQFKYNEAKCGASIARLCEDYVDIEQSFHKARKIFHH